MTSLRDELLTPTREGTTASLGEHSVEPDVAIGSHVGRYLLLERIGVGGMGVVYAAYDPELDRKVAVKLLQDRQGRAHVEGERDRLVAEAQALARLNHPNVVTVHDVGVDAEDRVFVAMAYLRGPTLGRWRKKQERTWDEVVRMLVAAGRGLAAAHEEGIVHRDFKPDNVIVADRQDDRPGRPRVLDFGLALEAREGGEVESELAALGTSRSGDRPLTSSVDSPAEGPGRLVGTPAYMAPELYLRQAGDVLSDQFAFCVTAWELLYRERPFQGDNRIALATAIVTGPITDPPSSAGVPRFVERALRRGLRKDPAERWPTLVALLEALTDDPASRRRRRWIWGGVVAASGVAVWSIVGREQPDPCAYGQTRVAKVWGPDKEAMLRASFRATGVPYAETTAERSVQDLDAYAAQWVASHRDACEATYVRHEQSGRRLDARMGCLETQLGALTMTAGLMLDADVRVVEHAAAALASLPEPTSCAAVRVD
ncbi:MAG: serine/threonine protein kinase, partial [Nannocystaceae bacterium]|nr:serine/threonine protein kinase [Nannocystaceae bacterium]